MPSSPDSSRFVQPLPAHPSLEMQQKRAKNLLHAVRAGDAAASQRVAALHPRPPRADAITLADAQLVIARGHGFESWAALRRKIDALTRTPVEQFQSALRAGDVEAVQNLLAMHADVRAAVNAPIGPFGGRPLAMVKRNLPLVDALLAHGADLNAKSDWWAGPFGLLEYDITPEDAAPRTAQLRSEA